MSSATDSTCTAPSGPVARRSRTWSNDVTCSSCWSVAAVGGHSWSVPSAIASSASPGRIHVVLDDLVAVQ